MKFFKAKQTLWLENQLKLKISLYKVLCAGNQQGMLEMVINVKTLASIHVKEGGAISQFFKKLDIKNLSEISLNVAIDNFLLNNVAYCLAIFVLGIGDRHNNIMIKKWRIISYWFWDFFGNFKYKMEYKREKAPFVFTRQFLNVLGDDNSQLFKDFKDKLKSGYTILRNNKDAIVAFLRIIIDSHLTFYKF